MLQAPQMALIPDVRFSWVQIMYFTLARTRTISWGCSARKKAGAAGRNEMRGWQRAFGLEPVPCFQPAAASKPHLLGSGRPAGRGFKHRLSIDSHSNESIYPWISPGTGTATPITSGLHRQARYLPSTSGV